MNSMIVFSDWCSRCMVTVMVCTRLMHKKNTSKDCVWRDNTATNTATATAAAAAAATTTTTTYNSNDNNNNNNDNDNNN